ncbi:MAG: succinate dehydrogenase, cytochrome b556 subunit [Halofilum sp. (in: g-proteobacteria)]|nr:succinate dehydrogenase, cytochrome b556 subunit [Halofilum sp. (in: g-proteobacteria)]
MAADRDRPLSPHLQVYRLPLNAITSITHRITGIALALGAVLLVAMLVAAADGSQAYRVAYDLAASWAGRVILLAFTLALYYHLCAGVRHLFWDAGYGYGLDAARRGSWAIIVAAIALTVSTWALALTVNGS